MYQKILEKKSKELNEFVSKFIKDNLTKDGKNLNKILGHFRL